MRTMFLASLIVLGLTTSIAAQPDAGVTIPPPPAEPSPVPVASSPAAPSASEPKPSEQLPNPVDDPRAAYDAVKAAKKQGWAAAILASLVMLTAGFARASTRWPTSKPFAWVAKHKTVLLVISGVSLVSCAAFDALVLGGQWMAVLWAAIGAALTLIVPTPTPPPEPAK